MPATLHVIFGPCGAGKTTYALALARREGAVPFVLDDWGARLFGPDVDGPIDFGWMLERLGVPPEMFELIEQLYEAPEPAELEGAVLRVTD